MGGGGGGEVDLLPSVCRDYLSEPVSASGWLCQSLGVVELRRRSVVREGWNILCIQ